MVNYSYQAMDASGKTVKGTLQAVSMEAAEEAISSGGLIPFQVSEVKTKESSSGGRSSRGGSKVKVKAPDLILYSKQFRSMFRAGIPILRVLEVLELQSENKALKRVSVAMVEDIKQGSSLRDAMAKHPDIFSPLYCGMINAGEVSGNIPEVLDRLTYILEHENKVKSDIKSALQYPKVVMVALGIAFFVLLGFVIPKFAAIFAKAGLTLPLPTRMAIALHHYLIGYWYVLLAIVATIFIGLKLYFKTENGLFVKDSFLLRLPIFGPLFIKSAMSRFSSIFAILISSGIPVMDTMKILSETIGNAAISRAFTSISAQMEEGKGISGPLANAKLFTPMVVNMVAIGEESGNLEGMLLEITKHYDEEVSHAVSRLADLITPVLTVCLAGIVAFFALAIFMPMWDLTKMVKH
jgi:type IV pilus assembly protein PilC